MHPLQTQGDAQEAPEHAESPDRGVEELGLVLAAAPPHFPVRQQEVELDDVFADRTDGPVVLAVDVHAEAAAEGGEHRSGYDSGPPAVLDRVLPELLDRHAGLELDDSLTGIPGEDPLHAREVQADVSGVERGIAVALARAAEPDRHPVSPRELEHLEYALGRARPVDVARGARRPAPSPQAFEPLDRQGTRRHRRAGMGGPAHRSRRRKMRDGRWRITNMIGCQILGT